MNKDKIPFCPVPEVKKENKLKKLVRKAKEKLIPTRCSIRFDGEVKLWAVLDEKDKLKTVRHFSHGVMKNVTFESIKVSTPTVGCGPGNTEYIGVATGDLVTDYYGKDAIGFHNFNFSNGMFVDSEGNRLERAETLRLFSDRRSLYK